jgi:hypothetical protein
MVTEVIKQPNSLKNYGFTFIFNKRVLGSFKTELTYIYNSSKTNFFLIINFNAINRRQNIDFGLG